MNLQPLHSDVYLYRPTAAANEALRLTLAGYFELYGYTALTLAVAKIEGQIARENRARVAREGWIA